MKQRSVFMQPTYLEKTTKTLSSFKLSFKTLLFTELNLGSINSCLPLHYNCTVSISLFILQYYISDYSFYLLLFYYNLFILLCISLIFILMPFYVMYHFELPCQINILLCSNEICLTTQLKCNIYNNLCRLEVHCGVLNNMSTFQIWK